MANFLIDSTAANPKTVGAIQQLLDSDAVHDGDIIVLKGTFSQTDTQFLRLSKSVTLRGDTSGGATLLGGKQLEWGRAPDGIGIQPIAATMENITLRHFTIGGIQMMGAKGENVIRNCRFEDYRYGEKPGKKGAWPIVGGNAGVSGALTITGCHFGAPSAASVPPAGLNNLIHLNNCDLDTLTITNNVIEDMHWVGIAVWGVSGQTVISGNTITKKSSFGGFGAGISFGATPDGYVLKREGSALIEGNTVNIEVDDSCGIIACQYPDQQYKSGAPGAPRAITVRDNVINMKSANNNRAALACIGGCSGSSWTNNRVTGVARYGILVTQDTQAADLTKSDAPPVNDTFEGNDLTEFKASQAQIFVDEAAAHIALRGNTLGPVLGSNKKLWPPPLENPRAGIAYYGSLGHIVSNDFAQSDIPGWIGGSGNRHVGCIYLGQVSRANAVEYSESDFPNGTGHPQHRQILDEDVWEGKSANKAPPDANTILELAPIPR
ncbi:MAG TPA: right-handed parallel beta-helix repeat-containing protein [Gemmatimonadaceae bacterium]|nr:right-handed parallel beta-helix repeat-containing protein [Gemmatimonadaceae bacterium]